MASTHKRLCRLVLVFTMTAIMLGVLAAAAYADTWWSYWNDWGTYSNRAAVTIYDAGGVNGATQLYHTSYNVQGCQLHAKLYGTESEVVLKNTGWVGGYSTTNSEGKITLFTDKYYSYAYHCFGWGNTYAPNYGYWQTHQSPKHTYP